MEPDEKILNAQAEELITGQNAAEILFPTQETGREFTPGQAAEPRQDHEEKPLLFPMPTSYSVQILHGALTAKSPDVFRHTVEYTPQKWSLSWESESQNIAIEHYNPQRLSGSNKSVKKILLLILSRALRFYDRSTETLINDKIEIPLSELVELGMFSNTHSARVGVDNASEALLGFAFSGRELIQGKNRESGSRRLRPLFSALDIVEGVFSVILNREAYWPVIFRFYGYTPIFFYGLNATAADIVYSITAYARQHAEEIINRKLKVKTRYIQEKAGLPPEIRYKPIYSTPGEAYYIDNSGNKYNPIEGTLKTKKGETTLKLQDESGKGYKATNTPPKITDPAAEDPHPDYYIIVKDPHPERNIREPIEAALDEINEAARLAYADFPEYSWRLELAPIAGYEVPQAAPLDKFLDGYIEVSLGSATAEQLTIKAPVKAKKRGRPKKK